MVTPVKWIPQLIFFVLFLATISYDVTHYEKRFSGTGAFVTKNTGKLNLNGPTPTVVNRRMKMNMKRVNVWALVCAMAIVIAPATQVC